jgi:hypothetical protein
MDLAIPLMGVYTAFMAAMNQIERIESRRRKIGDEIERLEREMDELDTALKVIRLIEAEAKADASSQEGKAPETAEPPKLGPPRPSGAPTNFEMVDMILASAEKEGKDGLTVPEIIVAIRSRYWPGLADVQVSSSIYKFAKDGRFKKTASGKIKRLKKIEGPNAGAPEPSH